MKPRILTVVALSLVVLAGGLVLWNRTKDGDPVVPNLPSGASGPGTMGWGDGRAPVGPRRGMAAPGSGEKGTPREALALVERDRLTAQWQEQASAGFAQTRKQLVADLGLEAARAAEVEKVFARREVELGRLLARMVSGEDDQGIVPKVCALIRHKGLRGDLVGVLSEQQLAAFDERAAKRGREMVEARAYRDLAKINAVVQLADTQKQDVLGALLGQAPDKVEQEADARAFMSLTYGPLAADMDSSHMRGLANMLNQDEPDGGASPDFDSEEYRQRVEERNAERIESELSALRDVLDEKQLNRYREHLEAELPR